MSRSSLFVVWPCLLGLILSQYAAVVAIVAENISADGKCHCHSDVTVNIPPCVCSGLTEVLEENKRLKADCSPQNPMRITYIDCRDAYERGQTQSGVYIIKPGEGDSFAVYCDMEIDGGGWAVFQRRQDAYGSQHISFFLYWNDYERGFGDLNDEFWLGLSKIHRLTISTERTELRVDLEDFSSNTGYAKYANFGVGDSSSNYTLTLSGYIGTAGDSLGLSRLSGAQFSTRDRNNDEYTGTGSCANLNHGAWWFRSCANAHLNGVYMTTASNPSLQAIFWGQFTTGGAYPLKYADMKLRRI